MTQSGAAEPAQSPGDADQHGRRPPQQGTRQRRTPAPASRPQRPERSERPGRAGASERPAAPSGRAQQVVGQADRQEPATPQTGRLVLRGARWPGDVAIAGGLIEAVGYVDHQDGDRELRCESSIITPGLINTHHHLYQALTRGRAVDSDVFGWLKELYPVWGRLTVEDVRAAARYGLAELAMSGCTTVVDHHVLVPGGDDAVFDVIVAAAREVGVRLYLARGAVDLGESRGGLPPDHVVEEIDAVLASTERIFTEFHDGDRVSVAVAPYSPYAVTGILLREAAVLARRLGARLHTHLAETAAEEEYCVARFGVRPLEYLERQGWLAGDVWFAHGIHFDDAEVARLGAARAGVAHCPSADARHGSGICRVADLEAAGAPVGLGSAGLASHEHGGLLPELRQALYTARLHAGSPAGFGPQDALRLATSAGARVLGRADLGRLERGRPADLAVWPASDLGDIPDPVTGLVLGQDRAVRHLFVAGEQVVADGALTGLDRGAARKDLLKHARRLWS